MSKSFRANDFGFEQSKLTITDLDGTEFDVGFLACGDEGNPLALCLHGYPDSAWTWRFLLPELARAGFWAVAPFSRGYSPTAVPGDGCFQAGVLGVDANKIHAALGGNGDAVVIGHDWGAMGTYAAAALEPERWRRAVAAAVMPGPSAAEAFFSYDQLKMSWYMFFQLTEMADMFVPFNEYDFISRLWEDWSPGYDSSADVAAFVESMGTPQNLTAALSYYRHTLVPGLQDDRLTAAQAAVFTVPPMPLLYLHGTNDGCMSPTIAATVGQHLSEPESRVSMISDAGHFLHLEQPETVNREIVAFISA